MDPEIAGWLKLLQGGGNAAAIGAVFIGWHVYKLLKEFLTRMMVRQERIERAIIAGNPKTAAIFNEPDPPQGASL